MVDDGQDRKVKQVWRAIVASEGLWAVVLFNHGLEKLQLPDEADEHRVPVEKTLRDFGDKLVGIYDRRVEWATFQDDVQFAMAQLSP